MTIRQGFPHGSPEHWRGRYQFRATVGWDPEEVFASDDYVVAPADDGTPAVALGIGAYRKMRDANSDPANLAHIDQCIALLADENAQCSQETDHG